MATNNTVTLADALADALPDALKKFAPVSVDSSTIILAINPATGQVGTVNIPAGGGNGSTSIQNFSTANLNQIQQFLIDSGILTTTQS